VEEMRVHLAGGRNADGLGWWQKCGWIGLVADMQLDWDATRNVAALGW
jgi:hypothetical protein